MKEERYHIALDKYDKKYRYQCAQQPEKSADTGGTPHRAC